MDNKQFTTALARSLSVDYKEAADLAAMLSRHLVDLTEEGSIVAIPSFGQFMPVKHAETVVNDISTGRRMLLPPSITLEFTPGSLLVKRLEI